MRWQRGSRGFWMVVAALVLGCGLIAHSLTAPLREQQRSSRTLDKIDQAMAERDDGPVIRVRIER